MDLDRAFWRGRRVFLTGHTGFKGAWLSLWLEKLGARVTGYALEPPSNPSLFEVARVAQGLSSLLGDVRDLEHLSNEVERSGAEILIHMAAQSLVRKSYADPVTTYATNVMGTVHVLEAARRVDSVRVIVNVTSDKCYENREWLWGYREDEPMGGFDPYSSSKGCSELVTAAYRRSFFSGSPARVAIASARAGNVIGGGDWATDRLVPDFLRAIRANGKLIIRNPEAIRPWQFVLDPLCGYLLLAQAIWKKPTEFADAWNFGPPSEDERPVRWIARRLVELWGHDAQWETHQTNHAHEASFLKLDCSKARARLGWRPRTNLDDALNEVVHWFRALLDGADMRDVTVRQIANYERRLTT
jgi:CDP-glucose 4,6-dehydratase